MVVPPAASRPREPVATSKDENGNYPWTVEGEKSSDTSDSDDSSDSDSSDTADSDSSGDKPADEDEYTPDPAVGNLAKLYGDTELMKSLYQMLSNDRFKAGKGGNDSTPNPMFEAVSGKKFPVDYKSMISRPVDGTSVSPTSVPQAAIDQIQDPNQVHGGVIDPKKD